jgi:predicted phosphodiesterase
LKIGAIGDVHAEDELLALALVTLRAEGATTILCVGDIVDGLGDVDRCVALLAEAGALAVRGNHDRWLVEKKMRDIPTWTQPESITAASHAWLAALPAIRTVPTPLGALMLCHGVGDDDMTRVTPDVSDWILDGIESFDEIKRDERIAVVVCGHTHERMVRSFRRAPAGGRLLWLNPGTLKRTNEPGFALFDLERDIAQFFDVDQERGVRTAKEILF